MEQEYSVREVATLMQSEQPPVLLDVRGQDEWEIVHLENARLLDQSLLDEMADSWPQDTPIVCYCHHGVRSLNAMQSLRQKGFTNVRSMAGGIDLWAQEVDPSLPRY